MSEQRLIKQVTKGKEARDKIVSGIDILADAVKVTLGARGRNVLIEEGVSPHLTKDGVTVAHSINLEDPLENLGVLMVREAAYQTVKQAGDGTTTSTVLAQEMVHLGMKLVDKGHSPVQLQRQMLEAAEEIVGIIEENSIEVTDDMVKDVALISANGEQEVGEAIAEAALAVGDDGIIMTEDSKDHKTYVEMADGLQIRSGYIHGDFINVESRALAEHRDVNVLVLNQEVEIFDKDLINAITHDQESPIVIVAKGFSSSARNALAHVFKQRKLDVLPVIAPGRGEHQSEYLEDIAIAVGAQIISPKFGLGMPSVQLEHYGKAKLVKSGYNSTTIMGYAGDKEKIQERIDRIKVMSEEAQEGIVKEGFKDRLARLTGKMAMLYVGASNNVSLREKKDRVDDALGATHAALTEGIVPGGGVTLNYIGNQGSKKPMNEGASIVYQACLAPMRAILSNAGMEMPELDLEDARQGVNVVTEEVVDVIDAGVIDPALVVKCCVRNAASVAGSILTTECVINNKRYE